MTMVSLTDTERQALQTALKRARDAPVVKRAHALRWLDQGASAVALAQRLGFTRQTISNWVAIFHARSAAAIPDRLRESARSARPPTKREAIKAVIAHRWQQSSDDTTAPRAVPRTAPALQRYVATQQVPVHERPIRRTVRALH